MRIRTFSNVLVALMMAAGAVAIIASVSTLNEVSALKNSWIGFSTGPVKKTGYLSDLREAIGYGGFIHDIKNAVLRTDDSYVTKAIEDRKRADEAIAKYLATGVDDTERADLDTVVHTLDLYSSKLPRLSQMIDDGQTSGTMDAYMRVDDDTALAALDSLRKQLTAALATSNTTVADAVDTAQTSIYVTLLTVCSLILLLTGFFLWFSRSRLIRPIYRLMEYVNIIGAGDLTRQIPDLTQDEVGTLGSHLNEMVASLKEITIQTRMAVNELNQAAAETLASARQQAASVEEQFAAVQETTATLDEINQSGQQMSSRAREIAGQAEKASESSREGLRSMDDMAQVMDAIEEQTEAVAEHIVALSEKTQAIGEIITSVNDIAERSQLLALNAAIEAATAGEHGRAFAVVADEIKTLADQAKEATNQVASILGDIQKGINSSVMSTEESVKRVASGREQAEITLSSIKELTNAIESSAQAFEQVVASTNQQRAGIDQVTEALQQIRASSEQTAAGTRQIEEAVSNIGSLGGKLSHTMERYAV